MSERRFPYGYRAQSDTKYPDSHRRLSRNTEREYNTPRSRSNRSPQRVSRSYQSNTSNVSSDSAFSRDHQWAQRSSQHSDQRGHRSPHFRDRSPLGNCRTLEAHPQNREYPQENRTPHGSEILYRRDQDLSEEADTDRRHNQRQETHQLKNSDIILCHYCGNDLCTQDECRTKKGYHKRCYESYKPRCEEAVKLFRDISKNEHVLCMAIHVKYVYGCKEAQGKLKKKEKKEKRAAKVTELLQIVSALRNSNSGVILIHLVGLDPGDNFIGAFDEFADVKLKDLINDGSLFDNVYKKQRLSEYESPELKDYTDVLVLYVEGADCLESTDIKTKEALDDSIVDISKSTLLKFIQKEKVFKEEYHDILKAEVCEDLRRLQESRHIQAKTYVQMKQGDSMLVDAVFNDLRVTEYISAFSKTPEGGSYLLGLCENPNDDLTKYQSKILKPVPIVIDDCDVVKRLLVERVSGSCLVCDYNGTRKTGDDLVKISFIPSKDSQRYVVHVSVRSVTGVVFYDNEGPEAYKVDPLHPSSITRLDVSEWFRIFRERGSNKD